MYGGFYYDDIMCDKISFYLQITVTCDKPEQRMIFFSDARSFAGFSGFVFYIIVKSC